jgi:hypothetical protein
MGTNTVKLLAAAVELTLYRDIYRFETDNQKEMASS